MADSTITSATTSSSGTTRFAGLFSSTDVDGLVKASLTYDQKKIENQQSKIQIQEWTNDAYKDINLKIAAFQNAYLSVAGNNSMTLNSAFNTRKVTVSGATGAGISITAGGNVSVDNLSIEGYTKATTASVSQKLGLAYDPNNSVADMTVNELADKLQAGFSAGDEYTFSINGTEFTIGGDEKVSDLLSKINNSDAGVKASYNTFTGTISLETVATGKNAELNIQDDDGLLSQIFGPDVANVVHGENAKIKFAGNDDVFEFESNQFTIDGYTFNISDNFNMDSSGQIQGAEPINVSSEVDVDAIVNKITTFVNAYNDLMSTLAKYAYTRPDKNYKPLSDSDKEKMTTAQIDEWNEKAKASVLYGDRNVQNLMRDLQQLFTSTKSEEGTRFWNIGIQLSSYTSAASYGKVDLDETKLRNAITANPNDVVSMFTSRTESDTATKGIAIQMNEIAQKYQDNYRFNLSDRLNKTLTDMKTMLETLKTKLAEKEDRLYKKYSAMETTIAKLTGQSSFLFS